MNADEEHLIAVLEQVLCAISMVDVIVDDGYAFEPVHRLCMCGSHCYVVEYAEPGGGGVI